MPIISGAWAEHFDMFTRFVALFAPCLLLCVQAEVMGEPKRVVHEAKATIASYKDPLFGSFFVNTEQRAK